MLPIIYTKDMKTLVKYPEKKEGNSYTVPETVEKIEDCAFIYTSFETVTIPDSVKSYGDNLFRYSKNLSKFLSDRKNGLFLHFLNFIHSQLPA